jgi:anti-sigma factor RsiW
MTLSRCTGEPISWLRLERYRLGELAEGERARVAEHLTACATCAGCMERIEADETVTLPALELGAGAARPAGVATPASPPRRLRLLAGAGALAAAAVMVLGIGRTWRGSGTRTTERGTALLKGDGMAFVLVRDDGQRLEDSHLV